MTWPNDCQKKLEVGRKERNPFLECGGKRSATPLWIRRTRKAGTLRQYWRAPEIQSAVAAALCRRTPKPQCGGAKHILRTQPRSGGGSKMRPSPASGQRIPCQYYPSARKFLRFTIARERSASHVAHEILGDENSRPFDWARIRARFCRRVRG